MVFYFLCAILFFLPSYLLRIKIFGLPTNFLELLIIFSFVIFLIGQLKNNSPRALLAKYRPLLSKKTLLYGIIFVLGGIFLASILAADKSAGFGILKSWFIVPLIFFFILFGYLNELKTPQRQEKIKLLIMSLALSGFIYLAAFAFGPIFEVVYKIEYNFITFDNRLRLFFDSPNQLAMALTPVIFAFFSLWFGEDALNKVKKMAYFNLTFVFIILLLLTKSLGAILAVLAAFLIFYLIKKAMPQVSKIPFAPHFIQYFNRLIVALIFLLFFLAILFPAIVTLIYNQPKSEDRSSFASRIIIWQSARAILADNLILGVGPGNFQAKYLEYQKKFPPYLEWAVPHPHNTFLTFWTSGGIFALIGFLIIIFYLLKSLISALTLNQNAPTFDPKKDKQDTASHIFYYFSFLILYFIYFLAHSSIDTLYFKNDLSVVFWFMVALLTLQNLDAQSNIKLSFSSLTKEGK